jgi:hypothetical protein
MTPCKDMASPCHLQLRHAATTANDYANARTERKASNREHLRAFSFYFRTSKYCNPTPPFAYYKRGGRDPQRGGETREKATPSIGNVLSTHPKTLKRTHSQKLGSHPSLDQLVTPYYKHSDVVQHEQQRALDVGTFGPNQYTSCVRLA